jgi:acetyltransferase-like isoleucine patch superfamily enzyme
MNLVHIGKKVLGKHPGLLKFLSYLFYLLNFNKKSIKGHNNFIDHSKGFLNNCEFIIKGSNNKITLGEKCYLKNCKFIINGNNNKITLDNMVCAYDSDFHLEDEGNVISIGERTLISGRNHLACIEGTAIHIGKECLLSSEIVFRTGDSHSILNLEGQRINPSQDIRIADHVWIGHRVLINKSVEVNVNSIIGTGAILTKKYEEANVIISGVPAKVIKRNINWDKSRI